MKLDWERISQSLTRREWVRLLLGVAAWLPAPVLLAVAEKRGTPDLSALNPFLDTLLPGADIPSATELKVGDAIVSLAHGNKGLQRLLVAGCGWLDQEASNTGGRGFTNIHQDQREAIVSRAEKAAEHSLPRIFFLWIRDLAFQHYYTQPASWKGLNYLGPPQPKGFNRHDLPPEPFA